MKNQSEEAGKIRENSNLKRKYESETSESDANPPQKSFKSKLSSFKIRTISSAIMIASFIIILSAGHIYCCLLVLLINICIFKEIIGLKRNEQREAKLPYNYMINWYFFAITELVLTSFFISDKIIKSQTIDVLFN